MMERRSWFLIQQMNYDFKDVDQGTVKDLSGNEYLPSFSVIKGTEADGSVAASADQVLIQ